MSLTNVRWNSYVCLPVKRVSGYRTDFRGPQQRTRKPDPSGRRAIAAAAALLLAFSFVVSARAGGKPGTNPPPELVGQWHGQGRIVNNWTSVQSLPVNLIILPDGTVSGQVGIANIAGGSFEEYSNKRQSLYVLNVNLEGALLADGVIRRSFRLNLKPEGARITGFGASDGSKLFPGASRESMRRSMRLQVTSISLTKSALRVVP